MNIDLACSTYARASSWLSVDELPQGREVIHSKYVLCDAGKQIEQIQEYSKHITNILKYILKYLLIFDTTSLRHIPHI